MTKNTVSQEKIDANRSKLEIRLPDTREVIISRWGAGNLKLGAGVITYSKTAVSTCPGATAWCLENCYARRIQGVVLDVYNDNTGAEAHVPDLPADAVLCRLHVSGDFDSVPYIVRWTEIIESRPDVKFWAYTRSWRVPRYLPFLEKMRALPNMQLFASMDESTVDMPPKGWRIAWIEGDPRIPPVTSLVCPEERKLVENCEKCKFCFKDVSKAAVKDVIFLKH